MWKRINGQLIQMTDPSRTRFKTYISYSQLKYLVQLAERYDTHISYLLENGLEKVVLNPEFSFSKSKRLKNKVEFRTTCDKEILTQGKLIAKEKGLNFTDVIQAAVDHIDLTEVKNKDWRYRIE